MAEDKPYLCDSCHQSPWGPVGWEEFHKESRPDITQLETLGDNGRRIRYIVSGAKFYQQAQFCAWCSLLYSGFRAKNNKGDFILKLGLPKSQWENVIKFLSVTLTFPPVKHVVPDILDKIHVSGSLHSGTGFSPLKLQLGVFAISGRAAAQLFFAPSLKPPLPASFNDALARQWMSRCRDNHSRCSDEAQQLLPSRVVDLTDFGLSSSVFVRSTAVGETGEYACLSYTWGRTWSQVAFGQLAKSLSDKPLDIGQLPATFQDAVRVAVRLGFQYLWIDALCIWQTDSEDLIAELAKMDQYYRAAELVIQCSGATTVDDAFLGEHRQCQISKMICDFRSGIESYTSNIESPSNSTMENDLTDSDRPVSISGSYGPIFTYPYLTKEGRSCAIFVQLSRDIKWFERSKERAASRGWVLQEQMLCRRILQFPSTGGMLFRCDGTNKELHDGNVFYDTNETYHTWNKEGLVGEDLDNPMRFLHRGRLRAKVDQIRYLAAHGANPALYLKGRDVYIDLDREANTSRDLSDETIQITQARVHYNQAFLESVDSSGGKLTLEGRFDITRSESPCRSDSPARSGSDLIEGSNPSANSNSKFNLDITSVPGKSDYSKHEESGENDETTGSLDHSERGNSDKGTDGDGPSNADFIASSPAISALSQLTLTDAPGPNTSILPGAFSVRLGGVRLFTKIGSSEGEILPGDVHKQWKSIISDYCKRQLTEPRDKLVAIAALAKEFSNRYSSGLGNYQAGIWPKYPSSLLWKVSDDSRVRAPLGSKRAPSWSWAAVEYASYSPYFLDNDTDILATEVEILECETVLENQVLEFGAVTDGFLKLRGQLLDVSWGKFTDEEDTDEEDTDEEDNDEEDNDEEDTGEKDTDEDGIDEEDNDGEDTDEEDISGEREKAGFTVFDRESGRCLGSREGSAYPDHLDCEPNDGQEPVTLLLVERSVGGIGHEDDHDVEGLVLKATDKSDTYIRVGWMWLHTQAYEKSWAEGFRSEIITIV